MNLRQATEQDQASLLAWRNDPETRAGAFTEDPVSSEVHQAWLRRVLSSQDHRLYVGEVEGQPIGLVRFVRKSAGVSEVSIVVAPEARGKGHGKRLLQLGCDQASGWVPRIEARVKLANLRSLCLFRQAGFQEVGRILTLP